jgi:hypothetical protein
MAPSGVRQPLAQRTGLTPSRQTSKSLGASWINVNQTFRNAWGEPCANARPAGGAREIVVQIAIPTSFEAHENRRTILAAVQYRS